MRLILSVYSVTEYDGYEEFIGIEAPDKDALMFTILEALKAQCGDYYLHIQENRSKCSYEGPCEAIVVYNDQQFEVNIDFTERDIETLDEFFERRRAKSTS